MKRSWLTLFALTSISLVFAVSGCARLDRANVDSELRRLCETDGGVTVYERATIPEAYIDRSGVLRVPFEHYAKPTDPFFLRTADTVLKSGDPSLERLVTEVVRRSDDKVLGRAVRYLRRGGDLPGPMHPSSLLCPRSLNLEGQVFIRASKEGTQ
jgi:hypothetical protein